ncbi:hypothetical protein SAMN05444422_108172 [Halobiforma haloterrestris]|uniref:Uncharacterized protein n=1 Tax=Natronobacterium haloterrestre TaxID=148448 RepID=A0A1I1J7C0_NATHA|nr:hypothetical protein [Halobiforma haloterrestris]SFC44444.1 hypothetical protein SAMN05444422_108172 [Halobiforma haloterrestris]
MTDPLDRVRRPEYTGEDRCWPCTITNALLLVVAVTIALRRGRRTAAAALAVVGTGAITLRGYLVPYTPRVAPRLVAWLPIDPFDHGEPGATTGSLAASRAGAEGTADSEGPDGDDVLAALLEADAVAAADDEIRLTEAFRADWRRERRALRNRSVDALAHVADERTPPSIEARPTRTWGRPVVVLESACDDAGPPTTLHRGVAVAELAADRALESRIDDPAIRRAAGRPLRSLLETCPLCDGELTVSRSSCCGETTPPGQRPSEKLFCPSCDERFFVFDEPGDGDADRE